MDNHLNLFILIIIAGFLVIKYKTNSPEQHEDTDFITNRGIARNRLDN